MLDVWQKTSAMSTKAGVPVNESWLHFHLSVGRAGAKTQSFHQCTTLMVMHPGQCIFVWSTFISPHSPFLNIFIFQGGVSMASVFLAHSCWGGRRTTDRTLGGDSSSN